MTKKAVRKKERFWILLDQPTAATLTQWCREQKREVPYTLRLMVEMWLAEGQQEAERRFVEGIDRPAQKSSPIAGIPGSTPEERAEYLVTGKVASTKHKSNAG